MKRLLLFAVVATLFTCTTMANRPFSVEHPNQLLYQAKGLIDERAFERAATLLESFMLQCDDPVFKQEAAYWRIYAQWQIDPQLSDEVFLQFLSDCRMSSRKNNIYYMAGTAAFSRGQYSRAIYWYDQVIGPLLSDDEQMSYLLRMGFTCMEQGDLDRAKIYFYALSDLKGDRSVDTYYNSYIAYRQNNIKEAQSGFQSLTNDPDFGAIVPYYLSQIEYVLGHYEQAIELAKPLLPKNDSDGSRAEMYRVVGESYYNLNRIDSAAFYLTEYDNIEERPLRSASYKLAICNFEQKNYLYALDNFSKVPGSDDLLTQNSLFYIALCYLQLDDKNNAKMAFERVVTYDFDLDIQEQAYYNLAVLCYQLNFTSFGETLSQFERFLNKYPDSRFADTLRDALIDIYMTTQDYKGALASIAKIGVPGPKIREAQQRIYFYLGTQSYTSKQYQQAVDYLSSSLSIGRSKVTAGDAHYWRAESYYQLKSYKKAVDDYESYIRSVADKSREQYYLACYSLGYCLFNQKLYDEASKSFRMVVNGASRVAKNVVGDSYNRMGDCAFFDRNFKSAINFYDKSKQAYPETGDYSLFQTAFATGLLGDYRDKIAYLNELTEQYQRSPYLDNALYEKGRSLSLLSENSRAIEAFTQVVKHNPESELARKSALQIGILYYTDGHIDKALEAYRRVVKRYKGSDEYRTALEDMKTIFSEKGEIEAFSDYLAQNGASDFLSSDEKESLVYLAAEKSLARGKTAEAAKAMRVYIAQYPSGRFLADAYYYLAENYHNQGDVEQATKYYQQVHNFPSSQYYKPSLEQLVALYISQKQYAQARAIYQKMVAEATVKADRVNAYEGLAYCELSLGLYNELVETTGRLLEIENLGQQESSLAYLRQAIAYQKLKNQQMAEQSFKRSAQDTRMASGAEAKYRLAQYYFELGRAIDCEREVLEFIEAGTPHGYWLARSFILISDLKSSKGDLFQAKQYLLSLKDNYKDKDDIQTMINQRIASMDQSNKTTL